MRAVIMAGGKGTRLQSIAKDIPKPMFPVLGKPILEYQIESLKKSGLKQITMIVGHLGHTIQEHFSDGSKFGVSIEYVLENTPLGTAGALFFLKDKMKDDFILLYGDLILDVDWNRFMVFHRSHDAIITLFGHPNAHPDDSDLIVVDENDRVTYIEPKNTERKFVYHNLVNAGLYCISPGLLDTIDAPANIDLEKQLIADQVKAGNVYAYRSTEYIKDVGTPDRLNAVAQDIRNSLISARSLRYKQKALFISGNGMIPVLNGFPPKADNIELLSDTATAIRRINASPYLAIVEAVTPEVNKENDSFEEQKETIKRIETALGKQGAYIDGVSFRSPFLRNPDGIWVSKTKSEYDSHDLRAYMLIQEAEKYNINLSSSWYIGNTIFDIQTGILTGMRTILVRTNKSKRDKMYDVPVTFEVDTLVDAVSMALQL